MARFVEVAHEGALRRGLSRVIEEIIEGVKNTYPEAHKVIADPKYVNSSSTSEDVNLLKIFGSVHCILFFEKTNWIKKKLYKQKKDVLLAVTEPEITFTLDGTPQIGNIRVYLKDLAIRDLVVEYLTEYVEAFKIDEVVILRDHILPPPKIDED